MEYYSAIKKKEILPRVPTRTKLEGLTLSERRHRKTKTARSHGHVEYETVPLTEAERGMVVARGWGHGNDEVWVQGHQLSVRSKFLESNVSTVVN